MEPEIINIKCPRDGAVLAIKNHPGIENREITCPVCKVSSPFSSYKRVIVKKKQEEEHTQYPGEENQAASAEGAKPNKDIDCALGKLRVQGSGTPPFKLNIGKNVIGRKASVSSADIQIPTGDSKRMSREHMVISVQKVAGRGWVHFASLCKERTNDTFLNGTRIDFGDSLILKDGDIITLPDAKIIFELPDSE